MGFLDLFKKQKMIHSAAYGDFPAFVSEEKLPDDLATLRKMGQYYNSEYSFQDYDPRKAFIIYSKLVRLDHQKVFLEARKSLGELYAHGTGVAKDSAKGFALMNEWYIHQLKNESSFYSVCYSLHGSLMEESMSLEELLSLSYQRLLEDQESYAIPVGMALFEHLQSLWKYRQEQQEQELSNISFMSYLYRTHKNPQAAFHLALIERKNKNYGKDRELLYEAAEAGNLFAIDYLLNVTLYYSQDPADKQEILRWQQIMERRIEELQQRAIMASIKDFDVLLNG